MVAQPEAGLGPTPQGTSRCSGTEGILPATSVLKAVTIFYENTLISPKTLQWAFKGGQHPAKNVSAQ